MRDTTDLNQLAGKTLTAPDGRRLGRIRGVRAPAGGSPVPFGTVTTGLLGRTVRVVPLTQATVQGDTVVVPYDKALVKHAPYVDSDRELASREEHWLYRHYGLASGTARTAGPSAGAARGRAAARRRGRPRRHRSAAETG